MPDHLPRACEERGGCPKSALPGKRKCADHDDSRARDNARRRDDPTKSKYNSAAWRRTSQTVRSFNPLCQRIIDGEQCRHPSTMVHHVLDPIARPDLFFTIFDPVTKKSQLVALCQRCHPPFEEGTPLWVEGKDFIRTEYKCAMLTLTRDVERHRSDE